ncbi:heterodisulfide reductase-related iron-sulfur binding cluster [uncultured Pseudodesulfovibrio sp.]|uniref:heterodisulfide reductase-related iron-sulfur binding cluster n=1 Tax=uncultured Pseudodesulfovibrio sp. TaxID=2035858 RepID=UPI0029C963A3|nr:heterodisulfide reductase-related iron-sulfur binding cluster [uncultured Pseudodesulfovibrio sp.]
MATHYGCHALRPSKVVQFDDPLAPTLFDRLVEVTGAESIDWPLKLQCCGNPLWGKNDALSLDLSVKKLEDAEKSEAHALCVACTYCQIQFDTVQKEHIAGKKSKVSMPSVLYPQLLGLAMGMDSGVLEMDMNGIKPDNVLNFVSQPD